MACKKLPIVSFQELHKQSLLNQVKQHAMDKTRVSKSSESSAWNRRGDCVKLLDEFEAKYKKLNKIIGKCLESNTEKYLPTLEKVRAETQNDYEQFVAESDKRIKEYEAKIEHIRSLKFFNEMASELCPEKPVNLPSGASVKPICWRDEENSSVSERKPNKLRREKSGEDKVVAAAAKLSAEHQQVVCKNGKVVTNIVAGRQLPKEAKNSGVILDRTTSEQTVGLYSSQRNASAESANEKRTKKLQDLKRSLQMKGHGK